MNPIVTQAQADKEQLKLLKILHLVMAAMAALFSCSFGAHIYMGWKMLSNPAFFGASQSVAPPELGWAILGMGVFGLAVGWSYAALLTYAAKCIGQRQNRTFILATAGVSCLNMPVGLALGIFTFIVLFRSSIKELFDNSGKASFSNSSQQANTPVLFDLSSVPDPDEATWKEIEEKHRLSFSQSKESPDAQDESSDGSEVIQLKQTENETLR